jgi:hypothetical protein
MKEPSPPGETPPAPADESDPAQVWGARIGRALGWLAAGALLVNLFTHWLF